VESASGRADDALFARHPEVKDSAVCEAKRELSLPMMEPCDVQMIHWRDSTLHFDVRRNGLGLEVGVVAIDGQVVMDASEVRVSFQDVALANRLLDQSFHV
jgi:hypothetical protein